MRKMEKLVEHSAIKFALMALVLLYLSTFFVDKSVTIACLLFFVATLIAILVKTE